MFKTSICLTVLFALLSAPPSSFYMHTSDEPEFRNNSKNFIEIDAASVIRDQAPDSDAKTWDDIHKAISKLGGGSGIHVRYYFTNQNLENFNGLKTMTKQKLADINIYVSCVDSQTRNDGKTWTDYCKSKQNLTITHN